jgi:hypothetical protein
MAPKAAPKKVVIPPKPLTPIQTVKKFTPVLTAVKAQAKGGTSGTSKTSSTPTPMKGGGATIGKPTPSLPQKKTSKIGSFFDNVGKTIKDAINSAAKNSQSANALQAKTLDYRTDPITGVKSSDIFNLSGNIPVKSGYGATTFSGASVGGKNQKVSNIIPQKTAPVVSTMNKATALDAQGNYSSTSGGQTLNPDGSPQTITNAQDIASDTPIDPKNVFGNTDYMKDLSIKDSSSTTTTPNADGSSTVSKTSYTPTPTTPKNDYGGIDSANKAIMQVNSDAKNLQADPWFSDKNSGSLYSTRIDTWTDGIAKGFNSADAFTDAYKNDTAFKANVDSLAKYGITPSSITSKVQNNANTEVSGIKPPQTTQEYLDSLLNIPKFNTGNKEMDKLMTEQALTEQNFTRQQIEMIKGDRDTIGMEEKNRIEAEKRIELETEKMANMKTSEREKAQYMIDKSKAEFDKADSEMEINRINSKSSMMGLLAKLGALDTSGAAGYALAQLDEKYQADRAELKSNYDLGVREINMNLNDSINKLQSDFDDNVIKINSDLNKSEREITLEIMKLQNSMNKDIIGYKMDAFKELQSKKDKAEAKALSNLGNYQNAVQGALWKGVPAFVASQLFDSQGNFINTPENAKIIADTSQGLPPEQPQSMKIGNKIYTLQPDGTYL